MKKRIIIGVISMGVLLLGAVGGNSNQPQPSTLDTTRSINASSLTETTDTVKEADPICDGVNVTTGCTVDGFSYKTYVYHPAVEEKSHTETVTNYVDKVVGYCTLCVDGTYSPSCATGRGACSHHGGVAQWNAPKYGKVPEYSTKTVIDTPAKEAYYEKVVE